MTKSDLDLLFSDANEVARIRAEAEFGLHEIEAMILSLPPGARVLEVGCGTGYLLAVLSSLREDVDFVGLEPIGQGFEAFEETLSRVQDLCSGISIHRIGIEDFTIPDGSARFDLVFSVNVMEHVTDWRKAVVVGAALLSSSGKMVVLCPNYSFPYEPHFRIPILLTPSLTRRVFWRRISAVEAEIGADGLWNSLNFITVPALRRHCRDRGLEAKFDLGVVARMLGRLDTDAEFARRQAAVARIARLLRNLGFVWFLGKVPADFSPYMKAVITRRYASKNDFAAAMTPS